MGLGALQHHREQLFLGDARDRQPGLVDVGRYLVVPVRLGDQQLVERCRASQTVGHAEPSSSSMVGPRSTSAAKPDSSVSHSVTVRTSGLISMPVSTEARCARS